MQKDKMVATNVQKWCSDIEKTILSPKTPKKEKEALEVYVENLVEYTVKFEPAF